MQFVEPICGVYLGWRMRNPPFVSETEEVAALSLLMTAPSVQCRSMVEGEEEEEDEGGDGVALDTSALPQPPPPPPSPLWSSVPKQHLMRVERATWKTVHRHQPAPFVALEVQEASAVSASALRRWSNRRVRLVGMVQHQLVPWLVGVGVPGNPSKVALDLSVVAVEPPFDRLIEVFGTLNVDEDTGIPQVQVQFFRRLQREHLRRLYRAREAQQPFVPLFVQSGKRRGRTLSAREPGRAGDGDSSGEEPDVEAALLHPCVLKFPVH